MTHRNISPSRRNFLRGSSLLLGSLALPAGTRAASPLRRYNAASREGRRMLQTFAAGIESLVTRPSADSQDWFVNAFIHVMDCPHGDQIAFTSWHQAYLRSVERSIRTVTGDSAFTIPYWDWTQSPAIPDAMFAGFLNPSDPVFDPHFANYGIFRRAAGPRLDAFFERLSGEQAEHLAGRGFRSPADAWRRVETNGEFADRAFARAITQDDPRLDAKSARMCSAEIVQAALSRTTVETFSSGGGTFSILEGLCHNAVHAAVGGSDLARPGFMSGGLAPIDPLFFLHHANIDRLWNVWIRKQQASGLPSGSGGGGRFLFPAAGGDFGYDYEPGFGEEIVAGRWQEPVRPGRGGITRDEGGDRNSDRDGRGRFGSRDSDRRGDERYPSRDRFPLGGEARDRDTDDRVRYPSRDRVHVGGANDDRAVVRPDRPIAEREPRTQFGGRSRGAAAMVEFPQGLLAEWARGDGLVLAKIALPMPMDGRRGRCFDLVVNAPDDGRSAGAESPHYAATLSFFDVMPGMSEDSTFSVPLGRTLAALDANGSLGNNLVFRVVPRGNANAVLEGASVELW